ncbi:MAG: methyltransferase domain-containing protein [Bacteroidia bacterium]|nr:methyltransferase domain-containing protein [Bacteroidia bacterium]
MKASSTAFSEEEYQTLYPEGFERYFWHIARNELILHYLNRWRAEPLLEIGAGRGQVVAALRQAGWDARGVEIANMPPLSPELPIQYEQDAFLLPDAERTIYKSIALFDVLEHLPNRIEYLAELRRLFPQLRYLYLTLPARPELWSNHDEFNKHYLRYTPEKLREELAQGGYRLIFWRYAFHSLYWVIRLNLMVRKKINPQVNPPRNFQIYLHKLIGKLFYWEGRLLPRTWYGSSLIAVAAPQGA